MLALLYIQTLSYAIIKPMNVRIVEPSGYCKGVQRALEIAKKTKLDNPNNNVVVLGMLVHNLDALKEIEDLKIKTLFSKDKNIIDLVDEIEENSIVILTAHGHSKAIEDKLNSRKLKFVDATCPFVKKAMDDMQNYLKDGYSIIYIGKAHHPESDAALSLSKNVHLLTLSSSLSEEMKNSKKTLVVSQSTFSSLEVNTLLEGIKKEIKNVVFYPSICSSSLLRQKALLNIDKNVDLILVIGGKNSNNTITLYSLAKANFTNSKVMMVENKSDLKENDFLNLKNIAIVSGASTPKRIIEEIKDYINELND